jgi:hypothetical protein
MRPTDILKEAEADLASLAGLPAEIRAKVKAGVAELTRIRDAIDATIASLTGSAQVALASLEAMAAAGGGWAALESKPDPVLPGPILPNAEQPSAEQPSAEQPATASFGG